MGMEQSKRRGHSPHEHFTVFIRNLGEEPAFRAMSPTAQILYLWLRLEWRGEKANNNGRISLSYRQAAKCVGVHPNTIAHAFHDLQAKGFIVITQRAVLGVEGEARSPLYELTELAMPDAQPRVGRKLYREWQPGQDFEVQKHHANNPNGHRGKSLQRASSKR